jgi:hypothetical protein
MAFEFTPDGVRTRRETAAVYTNGGAAYAAYDIYCRLQQGESLDLNYPPIVRETPPTSDWDVALHVRRLPDTHVIKDCISEALNGSCKIYVKTQYPEWSHYDVHIDGLPVFDFIFKTEPAPEEITLLQGPGLTYRVPTLVNLLNLSLQGLLNRARIDFRGRKSQKVVKCIQDYYRINYIMVHMELFHLVQIVGFGEMMEWFDEYFATAVDIYGYCKDREVQGKIFKLNPGEPLVKRDQARLNAVTDRLFSQPIGLRQDRQRRSEQLKTRVLHYS